MFATKTQILTAVLLAVASVHAQSTSDSAAPPDSTAGISPCIIQCVTAAATDNSCDFTDIPCVCASAQFQADARACLQSQCTAADLTAAEGLQKSQCDAAGITPTGTATTPAATGTGAGNSTASVPEPTANTTTTGTSARPTVTAPTGSTNTTRPTGTTNGTAPPASTTNAAVGMKGLGMGALAGVAALVGLVL